MEYTYSEKYGDHDVRKTKLLAKLRAETVKAMHRYDGERKPAYAVLETYSGRVTLHGDRLMKLPASGYHGGESAEHIGSLADYWHYLLGRDIAAQQAAQSSPL